MEGGVKDEWRGVMNKGEVEGRGGGIGGGWDKGKREVWSNG